MRKGFTLVEILISLFILGVGIVGILTLFPLAWQSLSYSRRLNAVSQLAQKKLEELRAQTDKLVPGLMNGKEGDLNWSISAQTLKLQNDIEVIYVELDIDFDFLGKPQNQKFVTYLTPL